MDGFVIGTIAALCFVSAGSLTRLAPQLANGPVDDDGQSPVHLMIAAAIQGVAIPLTAAAVGGAVGATLSFTQQTDAGSKPRWYALSSHPGVRVRGRPLSRIPGVLDVFAPPSDVETAVYAVLAVGGALCVTEFVLHSALLHEQPDDARPDEPVLCPQCDHVVPDLPFCAV